MDLYIDDGVKNRGHRSTLMSKFASVTGIAFCKHRSKYGTMTDFLYAKSFQIN